MEEIRFLKFEFGRKKKFGAHLLRCILDILIYYAFEQISEQVRKIHVHCMACYIACEKRYNTNT